MNRFLTFTLVLLAITGCIRKKQDPDPYTPDNTGGSGSTGGSGGSGGSASCIYRDEVTIRQYPYLSSQAKPGAEITFTAYAWASPDCRDNFTWDFGDGNHATTTSYDIIHIYQSAGQYEVKLTERDIYGNTKTDTKTTIIYQ